MGAVTAAVIGGAAAIGGAAMQANSAKKSADAARNMQNQALAQYSGIEAPTVSQQELDLALPELVGQYNPEMNQQVDYQNTLQHQDPEIKTMQMQALQQMADVSKKGLTDSDIAAYREMQNMVEGENQANQQSVLQNMQRRGTLGSGMELAAQLQNAQNAASRLSSGTNSLTQQAQARALQALTNTGNMGSQITNQNFKEQEAQDAINQYNARNRQDVTNSNVASKNQAQAANLTNRQNIANQQVALKNQQQQYNKGLIQQQLNNQLNVAAAKAGQYNANANMNNQIAANQATANANMLTGGANALTGLIGAFNTKPTQEAPTDIYKGAAPSYSTSDNYNYDPTKQNT